MAMVDGCTGRKPGAKIQWKIVKPFAKPIQAGKSSCGS
jgi:hypothetical protein